MFHRKNCRAGTDGDGAIQRTWSKCHLGRGKAEIGILGEGPGRDGPTGIAALHLLRAHIGMRQQQRIGILREANLRQHGFGPGRNQLRDLQIGGVDGKLPGGEHHQIGLLSIEFEGQQPRHARQHRDMPKSRPARDTTSWLDHHISQPARAIFIGTQICTAKQFRGQFASGEACFGAFHGGHGSAPDRNQRE